MTSPLDSPGRRDAPPSVDLLGHFRDLARVAIPALLIGILVGAGVFALRTALVPKQYEATVVATITPAGEIVPGDAFVEQLRAPFTALSTDENVLRQVLTQVDTGWDTAQLKSHVTLEPGTSPSLLSFTATAPSDTEAEQVARAMVTAISDAANSNHARDIKRQLDELQAQLSAERARNETLPARSSTKAESDATVADLNAQLIRLQNSTADSLSILASPAAGGAVSPKPVQEGAVAGIIAAIIAAEVLVFVRGRTGRRPNRIWARRVTHRYGAELSYGDAAIPASLLPAFGQRHRRGRTALIIAGHDIRTDVLPGPPHDDTPTASGTPVRVVQTGITDRWWDQVDPGDLTLALVVISAKGPDRADAEKALAQLVETGVTRYLIVQPSTGGATAARPSPPTTPPGTARPATAGVQRPTDPPVRSDGRHGPDSGRQPAVRREPPTQRQRQTQPADNLSSSPGAPGTTSTTTAPTTTTSTTTASSTTTPSVTESGRHHFGRVEGRFPPEPDRGSGTDPGRGPDANAGSGAGPHESTSERKDVGSVAQ